MAAVEANHSDGPWVNPEDYRRLNGVLRYSQGNAVNGFSVTGMAYHGRWNATDQVPRRALDANLISRFGAVDPTDGADTHRLLAQLPWVAP